jgi:hypothetical protein
MSNSHVSIELIVNGMPYIFNVDAADGSETELTNLVSGRGIGSTFSSGGVIQMARGGYCENYAVDGIRLLNEQGNVAYQFPVYRLEDQNAGPHYSVNCGVGLNFKLVVTTSATLA